MLTCGVVTVLGVAIFVEVVLYFENLVTLRTILHTIGFAGYLGTLSCQILLDPPHRTVEFDHKTLAAEIVTGSSIVRAGASSGHGMICAYNIAASTCLHTGHALT